MFGTTRRGKLTFEMSLDISRTSKAPKSRPGNVSGFVFLLSISCLTSFVVSVWAAVDQGLSDRIAAAIGHPSVKPLEVKPASEADKYRFVHEKL